MVNKISNLNFILNSLNNLYVSIFMKLFCRNNWNAENFWIKNTNVGCILIECEAHFQINVHDSSVGFLQLDSVSSGQRWVKQWQFHAGKLKFFFFLCFWRRTYEGNLQASSNNVLLSEEAMNCQIRWILILFRNPFCKTLTTGVGRKKNVVQSWVALRC